MHKKLTGSKAYHRGLVKRRSATVEPVLGTLINHHSMKRVNSRGLAQANKHVLMAALTYNLKKYLRFSRKTVQAMVAALGKPDANLLWLLNALCLMVFKPHAARQKTSVISLK